MQESGVLKKAVLFLCIFAIIVSACGVQAEIQKNCGFDRRASHFTLQIPRPHTSRPDVIDEGQWIENDDAASHTGISEKKSLFTRRGGMRFHLLCSVLTKTVARRAFFSTGMFCDSSCPTHGLLRTVWYILDTDGQKDNLSFIWF